MVEKHDRINPKDQIIGRQKIFDEHKKKILELEEMVMVAACRIENQPNLWKALQQQSSRDYLQTYSQTPLGINYIGVIKPFLAGGNTNNLIEAINLLSEILHTNTISVGQNGIESILPNSQNGGVPRHRTTCNQDIRRNLFLIKNQLRNPTHAISREECFDPILWTLINAEKHLKRMEEEFAAEHISRVSQKRDLKEAEQLRNLSGVIGISILAISHLAKFKYAELSYFVGSVPMAYAMIQHMIYMRLLRRLTKAKA